ncbi:hypothetical protein OSB04_011327, partial [Centaurea solstitialis]
MVAENVKIGAGRTERQTYESGPRKNDQHKAQNRDGLWCTYCKKARHTKENCWKIHGKPPSQEWGQKGTSIRDKGQAHVVIDPNQESKQETTNLNHEEVEKLRSFFITMERSLGSPFPTTGKGIGGTIGLAKEKDGLYCLEMPAETKISHSLVSESTLSNKEKILLHHCRLGHPSFRVVKVLFSSLFSKLDVENLHCEVCELAKHKRIPFPVSNKRSTFPFYLIHTDIWGPSNVSNISGARWFVTFIDDCTRVTWVFLLKHKSDVSSVLPNFILMIKNQFGVNIKRLRSDNARDYFNQTLTSYCQKEGIIHESSCVKTPQQNGVVERKNG